MSTIAGIAEGETDFSAPPGETRKLPEQQKSPLAVGVLRRSPSREEVERGDAEEDMGAGRGGRQGGGGSAKKRERTAMEREGSAGYYQLVGPSSTTPPVRLAAPFQAGRGASTLEAD